MDFSHISEGDTIKVIARRFSHQPEVFHDVSEKPEEITFTVARKTHPSGNTDVDTYLWEAERSEENSKHWNLGNKRGLCDGVGIDWYVEDVIVVESAT